MDTIVKDYNLNLNDTGDVILSKEERFENGVLFFWVGTGIGILVGLLLVNKMGFPMILGVFVGLLSAVAGFLLGDSKTTESQEDWRCNRLSRKSHHIEFTAREQVIYDALAFIDRENNHQGAHEYKSKTHAERKTMENALVMAKFILPPTENIV